MKNSLLTLVLLVSSNLTYASGGGAEDKIADVASWIVLLVIPIVGIYLFWQAHIYPEKVAERNNHPQLNAIKSLCLLSLFFGGLLWPFALVWANYKYTGSTYPNEEAKEQEKKVSDTLPAPSEETVSDLPSSAENEQNKG